MSAAEMPSAPDHRRYVVTLVLNADTPDEIEHVLRQLETDLCIDRDRLLSGSGRVIDVISGGYNSGYSLTIDFDPQMDGDRYRSELTSWADARRRVRAGIEQEDSNQ